MYFCAIIKRLLSSPMKYSIYSKFRIQTLKFTSIFLIVYILTLSFIPCDDIHNFNGTDIPGQTSISHFSDIDHCSPFCTCNCCHVFSLVSHKVILPSIRVIHSTVKCSYFLPSIEEVEFTFWQPPKIVNFL